MLHYVYAITPSACADCAERGVYVGAEETFDNRGPVEEAYLRVVAAFAEEMGVRHLSVREPGLVPSPHAFTRKPKVADHGLGGLFPDDLSGFHDGAQVALPVALELVRAMLRDSGAWCRLEVPGVLAVHLGEDSSMYIGGNIRCDTALTLANALGFRPVQLELSPLDAVYEEEPGVQRPADDVFWARLAWCLTTGEAAILEEQPAFNVSRWHRLTTDNLDSVRTRLTPRALLYVWPELSADVTAVLADLPDDTAEFVWEDHDRQIRSTVSDQEQFAEVVARISGARAAAVRSWYVSRRHPLFTGVLPDADGVLRARWRTDPAPSDHTWAFLTTLHVGDTITGTVTGIADSGKASVDIGGFTAAIELPELSWRPVRAPFDMVAPGQAVTVQILDVDLVRERVSLSLKSLPTGPMQSRGSLTGRVPETPS